MKDEVTNNSVNVFSIDEHGCRESEKYVRQRTYVSI